MSLILYYINSTMVARLSHVGQHGDQASMLIVNPEPDLRQAQYMPTLSDPGQLDCL